MVSGPPQRGAGTAESPVGWLIAVERLDPTSSSDAGSVDTYTDAPPLTDTPIEAETAEDLFKGIDALLQQKFADYQSQQAASAGAPGDLPPESELADDEEWVEVVAGDPPASSEGTSGGGGGNAGGGEDVNGRVVRQLIWGGCAGVVLRGSVRIEPLIAQVGVSVGFRGLIFWGAAADVGGLRGCGAARQRAHRAAHCAGGGFNRVTGVLFFRGVPVGSCCCLY